MAYFAAPRLMRLMISSNAVGMSNPSSGPCAVDTIRDEFCCSAVLLLLAHRDRSHFWWPTVAFGA